MAEAAEPRPQRSPSHRRSCRPEGPASADIPGAPVTGERGHARHEVCFRSRGGRPFTDGPAATAAASSVRLRSGSSGAQNPDVAYGSHSAFLPLRRARGVPAARVGVSWGGPRAALTADRAISFDHPRENPRTDTSGVEAAHVPPRPQRRLPRRRRSTRDKNSRKRGFLKIENSGLLKIPSRKRKDNLPNGRNNLRIRVSDTEPVSGTQEELQLNTTQKTTKKSAKDLNSLQTRRTDGRRAQEETPRKRRSASLITRETHLKPQRDADTPIGRTTTRSTGDDTRRRGRGAAGSPSRSRRVARADRATWQVRALVNTQKRCIMGSQDATTAGI